MTDRLASWYLDDFIALQALRPLSLLATREVLLAHPQWREHVDPTRIGGFDAGIGGESAPLVATMGSASTFGRPWSQ